MLRLKRHLIGTGRGAVNPRGKPLGFTFDSVNIPAMKTFPFFHLKNAAGLSVTHGALGALRFIYVEADSKSLSGGPLSVAH